MFSFIKKYYYKWKYRNYNKLTKFYTLNKINVWAKIVHVYDGDTVHAVFSLPNSSTIYKYKLRLAHIDTPELKSKNINEIKKAKEAKKVVEDMILDKIVYLELEGEDKYGRILANIYINNINLNQHLIDNKYAYKYEGGKKIKFSK
jgi:endonuclease YncB( thermonuclease family)